MPGKVLSTVLYIQYVIALSQQSYPLDNTISTLYGWEAEADIKLLTKSLTLLFTKAKRVLLSVFYIRETMRIFYYSKIIS